MKRTAALARYERLVAMNPRVERKGDTDPAVDAVGPLPREISTPAALVGFLPAHAKAPDVATALLAFLSSPDAAAVYKAKACGMQPGR